MPKLWERLLQTVAELEPVTYAEILSEYPQERACRVSVDLKVLQHNNRISYSRGRYALTDSEREDRANG